MKKRQRVATIGTYLPELDQKMCLELGCARGIIGWHMRQHGGRWVSMDTDLVNLTAARSLLGTSVLLGDPLKLPFADGSFEVIAALDILEHLENDEGCIEEIHRLMQPGGLLLVSAPVTGPWFLVNRIKQLIGLTPDVYGHVREGYDPEFLAEKLREKGFHVRNVMTFTRFFTEFVEMVINFGYVFFLGKGNQDKKRDGSISPSTENEFRKNAKTFRLYSLLYPFTWSFSQLDRLFFFLKGYTLLIVAVKDTPSEVSDL